MCGQGRLFARLDRIQRFTELFIPLEACTACSFRFSREPGYYFGVVTPVLPILALMTGVFFAGVAHFAFHREIDTVLSAGFVGVFIGFFLFFRTSIAVYVAFDHAVDPPKRDSQ